MTTEELKTTFLARWKAWVTTLATSIMVVTVGINWADERYDQRDDIGQIRANVDFLTRLSVQDRITRLDGRIQLLETLSDMSRDERQTLNELRLERYQLQRRLDELAEEG